MCHFPYLQTNRVRPWSAGPFACSPTRRNKEKPLGVNVRFLLYLFR